MAKSSGLLTRLTCGVIGVGWVSVFGLISKGVREVIA
jgi:hypothetical protein